MIHRQEVGDENEPINAAVMGHNTTPSRRVLVSDLIN
jgi:hypothetical protein